MYNRQKAHRLRLITTQCDASFPQPVTVSGTYRCTEGHCHIVHWSSGTMSISPTGYQPDFLAAVEAADTAALCVGDPETREYQGAYDAVLNQRGYGAVLL